MKTEQSNDRAAIWSTGAVVAAVIASACCWLPLLFLGLGVSAVGVSATFEKARPYFLVVAALLLGAGFYLNYFRKEKCEPGSECATPNPKLKRFNRLVLWIAAIAVLAFAFFPNYVGTLLGGSGSAVAVDKAAGSQLVLPIEGMTCDACATHVRNALIDVPGVLEAEANYAEGRAVIAVDDSSPPSREALAKALQKAGYDIAASPTNE